MPGCSFAAFRFCCPTGCVYESDDFNRADSTSLGAKWTETAGDWSIDGNRLKIASASAKCTCTTTHPTSSTKYLVSVSITLGTDGDVARVYLNASGQFAELERITSSCGRLRLYDGATCKGSVGVSLSGYTRLVLCSDGDKVHVGTGGAPLLTIHCTVTSSIVALGSGACTGTIYFEDFSLSKHGDDDATCPACGNEGCTWFSDNGCGSGSLSPTDWTATGTWAYDNGLKCTADGTITIVPTHPFAALKGSVSFALPMGASQDVGTIVRFALDGSTIFVECEIVSTFGVKNWKISLWSGGAQYGVVFRQGNLTSTFFAVRLCYDGSLVTADVNGGTYPTGVVLGRVNATLASFAANVTVSNLGAGQALTFVFVSCLKHTDDVATCAACASPTCASCAIETYRGTASITIAGMGSFVYGCTCTDSAVPLVAEFWPLLPNLSVSGCQWKGIRSGMCGGNSWSATATIAPTAGGYKITVIVMDSLGLWTATFEETVLGGVPDCLTDFDGDVPLISFSNPVGRATCDFSTANCTFTAP